MNKIEIQFIINRKPVKRTIRTSTLLIDLIRDELGLKGTKSGCNEGECGACSVLVNGKAINSCLHLAINIDGKEVTTIEGFSLEPGVLDPIQEVLIEKGAVQCGFCTSGVAISIKSFSEECKSIGKTPDSFSIRKSLEGNLCRCTGYVKIIDAAEAILSNNGGEKS